MTSGAICCFWPVWVCDALGFYMFILIRKVSYRISLNSIWVLVPVNKTERVQQPCQVALKANADFTCLVLTSFISAQHIASSNKERDSDASDTFNSLCIWMVSDAM